MSQTYFAILTAIGEAKLANAISLGTQLQVSRMAVGDGNGVLPVPIRTQTGLVHETYRADLNSLMVDPANASQIIAELVIPDVEGGYWLREMGLYDAAGDLIAVANCPPSYKPVLGEGSGRTQVMRMVLVVASTTAIQLKIDPSVVLATRAYVDQKVVDELNKQDFKNSVLVATTGPIVLSGLQTIDGVAVLAGQRVLVTSQAAAKDNGPYITAAGAWVRTNDADVSAELTPGLFVNVEQGTVNGDSIWQLTTDAPIVLGTTALTFEMIVGRTGVVVGRYSAVTVDKLGRVVGGEVISALDALTRTTPLTATAALTVQQMGLLLLDASAAACTFTLPSASAALAGVEVLLRRVDATANALVIAASGADKIMLDTTAQAPGQATTELLFAGDYLRLRSDSAGKWWCVGQAGLPGSLATGFTAITTTGVSTYTVPPVLRSGRRWAKVKVTGAGGGGAYRTVSPGPSGGAGGGVAEKRINLAGVSTVSATVGVGGNGAAADGNNGVAGGATSFSTYCSGPGGAGGVFNGNSPAGSVGSGGDINYTIGNASPAISGPGGSLFGGFGGGSISAIAASDSGTPAKAGCGGGGRTTSTGAPGANGSVEISW